MAEQQVATPADSVPRTAQTTANNIVRGITDRANGKAPTTATPPIKGNEQAPVNPAAVDPNAGKEKYVVEGKEVWLTPQERTAWIQKGMAFEPRMDQLARLQQETIQLQRALINDPGTVLANIAKQQNIPMQSLVQRILKGNASAEVKDIVGQWYYEEGVMPVKSPEEYAQLQKDRKIATYEQQEKDRQDMAIRQENQAKVAQAFNQLRTFIGEAMKESGLPSNDTPLGAEMARQVADVMRVAQRQRQTITPKQAIEHVKAKIRSIQAAYYETLEEDALVKELGETSVAKIQKYLLKKAQPNGANPTIVTNGKNASRNGKNEKIGLDDFHDYLDTLKKQG